jgi:hypothetical protein
VPDADSEHCYSIPSHTIHSQAANLTVQRISYHTLCFYAIYPKE